MGLLRNMDAPIEPTSRRDPRSDEAAGQVVMSWPLTSGAAPLNPATSHDLDGLGQDDFKGVAGFGARPGGAVWMANLTATAIADGTVPSGIVRPSSRDRG